MAIYHFSAKVIGRAAGSSAVTAAAYRSASRLPDERLGRSHDFSNKAGVVHSEVMLPDGAPERLGDRATLWNEVESIELRKDAQLAREIEFAIPREMSQAQGIDLAQDFVKREFVDRNMIADLNVHWDRGADGEAKPHAHVMLSMREVGEEGFGAKVRDWNSTQLLQQWREGWSAHANERCAELGIEARIDHRSYEEQGIALEPQHKIGPAGARRLERGEDAERATDHLEIARRNGEKIIADPNVGLDAITHQQSTFTTRDLARFAHRHSDGKEQFDQVLGALRGSEHIVALGKDGRGEERFTSRGMIEVEVRLSRSADQLDARGHGVDRHHVDRAVANAASRGLDLSREQRDALRHVTRDRNLSAVIGYAGSGKSAMLGAARETWEAQGYTVRGAALSGIAAENLTHGSGIDARTIASLEHQWARERDALGPNDILVIDEAGTVGTRQMERVLSHVRDAGAKAVLVGDGQQLQAIEAGAAFRSLAERHGAVEITEVRRQRDDWQRSATRDLANGRTGDALAAYREHAMVAESSSRERAREALIEGWRSERAHDPAQSRIILSHTRDEVQKLNEMARDALKQDGQLSPESRVQTTRGERLIAPGERIMFLSNERDLGVRNGTLATVEKVSPASITARLDDGRSVAFDLKSYADIDHGYATTIHKAQGVTVDRVHVLATPGLDQHSSYVGLSRHRDSVQLHYGRDDFDSPERLARTLGRERPKDMALDYAAARERFAEVRGFGRSIILDTLAKDRLVDDRHVLKVDPTPKRDPFAGLKLRVDRTPATRLPSDLRLGVAPAGREAANVAPDKLESAVERYAEVDGQIRDMNRQGLRALAWQTGALADAGKALDATRPEASQDLATALDRETGTNSTTGRARTLQLIRAMDMETQFRTDPEMRADRFVQAWQQLAHQRRQYRDDYDEQGTARVEGRMKDMAKSLSKDPALDKALTKRAGELGLSAQQALQWTPGSRTGDVGRELSDRLQNRTIGQTLMDSLGRGRGIGIGM